jgi:hypothetical protein
VHLAKCSEKKRRGRAGEGEERERRVVAVLVVSFVSRPVIGHANSIELLGPPIEFKKVAVKASQTKRIA